MDTVIGIIPIIIPIVLFYKKVNIFTYFDITCILETIFYLTIINSVQLQILYQELYIFIINIRNLVFIINCK